MQEVASGAGNDWLRGEHGAFGTNIIVADMRFAVS